MFGQAVKNNHPIGNTFYPASVPESRVAVIGVHIENRRQNIWLLDVGVKTVFVDGFGSWI